MRNETYDERGGEISILLRHSFSRQSKRTSCLHKRENEYWRIEVGKSKYELSCVSCAIVKTDSSKYSPGFAGSNGPSAGRNGRTCSDPDKEHHGNEFSHELFHGPIIGGKGEFHGRRKKKDSEEETMD